MSKTPIKVVAFNGPPRTGKDSIADALVAQMTSSGYSVARVQLSLPMRLAIFALIGQEYSSKLYEEIKDRYNPMLQTTLRDGMIALSETHVKPLYGHDFWCRSAIEREFKPADKFIVISDLGFQEEVDFLFENFGENNVAIVNAIRDGYGWGNDSRQPLKHIHESHNLELLNNGTMMKAATGVRNFIKSIGFLASGFEQV